MAVETAESLNYTTEARIANRFDNKDCNAVEMVAAGTAAMPKVLCLLGLVVAALLLIVFGLDLAARVPFRGYSKLMDIGFIIAAVMLAYLAWMTYREQV